MDEKQQLDMLNTMMQVIADMADPEVPKDLNKARRLLYEIRSHALAAVQGESQWINYYKGESQHYSEMCKELRVLKARIEELEALENPVNTTHNGWLQDLLGNSGISKEDAYSEILYWLSIHCTPNGI